LATDDSFGTFESLSIRDQSKDCDNSWLKRENLAAKRSSTATKLVLLDVFGCGARTRDQVRDAIAESE
jgi:hypothetical protein